VTLAYFTKSPGIGGRIKSEPEDFLVEEIIKDGTVLELDKQIENKNEPGKFIHFVLQKCDWSTSYAIREIAKKLHTSPKRFSYAGMKDKRALTTQLVSAQGIDLERIRLLNVKDIKINGAWAASDKVRLGALIGNRFTIKIKDAANDSNEKVKKINSELDSRFPNYFGEQRFGTISQNTHIIGEHIIRGDFEQAAMTYLTDYENENHEQAGAARQELLKTQDFTTALKEFPNHLKFERSMIAHLAANPGNFVGAFNTLPRQTLLLFIHAFQSYLFNRLLSDRIKEGKVKMEQGEYFCPVTGNGFPDTGMMDVEGWLCIKLLGYNSNPNDREKELLNEMNIKKEDFRIKEIPEISSKGTFRTAFAPLKDFQFKNDTFKFSLQSGSYATTALREFLEVNKT
jgi:tRNA pseudouridine13 synthase